MSCSTPSPLTLQIRQWIAASELHEHVDPFLADLAARGYARNTLCGYRTCVAHFASWMTRRRTALAAIDEALIERFVKCHLPACRCASQCQRTPYAMRAALNALLRFLRDKRLIDASRAQDPPATRLRLDDIDWEAGSLRIRGKGHRVDVMPLPASTGAAIARYLCKGRPRAAGPALFLRHAPPHWTPASVDVVRGAVRRAADRCGLSLLVGGPHILRHTIAHRLVRQRVSLKQIADLLRHRSLTSTTRYAKIDLAALARVAMPWPGGRS